MPTLTAPNLECHDWLTHGFGQRDSTYPEHILILRQVHSCAILDAAGEGDGVVSAEPGRLIGVRTADCVPILLADKRTQSVAAIHAGWRGTAGQIVGAALWRMGEKFGTRPEDVSAAVGPSIGGCCYEVSPEVAHQFGTWVPKLKHVDRPIRIDLKAINRCQLQEAGVRDVWVSTDCTYCLPEYFSFRREKEQAGRVVSFIGRRQELQRADP